MMDDGLQQQIMSVYNGFVTHEQQIKYYQLVKYLFLTIEKRLIKFYAAEPCDEQKFYTILRKLIHKINKIEHGKYQEPKFSDIAKELLKHLPHHPKHHHAYNQSLLSKQPEHYDSKTSLNFSIASRPSALLKHDKWQFHHQKQSLENHQEKKYRSLEHLNKNKIIQQHDQIDRDTTQMFPKNKYLKSNGNKITSKPYPKPPRIGEFIRKMNSQAKVMGRQQRLLKRVNEAEKYIGMRRKKGKKIGRSNMNDDDD